MEKNAIVKVELSGCTLWRRMFIEVMDSGSREGNERAAEARYATIFGGPFESRYCDQCCDHTQMAVELLSEKQRRRVLFKHLSGTMNEGEELYRVSPAS